MSDVTSPSPAATLRAPPERRRSIGIRTVVLIVAGIGVLVLAVHFGWHWFTVGRFLEVTDDAYLQADNVTVAPRVGGTVVAVPVEDNQAVKKGDLLAEIDPRDYRIALDQAQGSLGATEADLDNLKAQEAAQLAAINEQGANVSASQAAAAFARQESSRYESLVSQGAGTGQRVQQAASELSQRTASVTRAEAALVGARKQIDVLHAQIARATALIEGDRARVAQAQLDLDRTQIRAPIDGIVGDRTVRTGQLVQPTSRLMTLVPVQDVYVIANFKETQLGDIETGQHVAIDIDALPSDTLHGTVASLAPGSGSQFSLLPPENATGNFTKIVQRVPVKIRFDRGIPLAKLRPGLSATVSVDIRSGPSTPP